MGRIKYWLPSVLWAFAIFYLSSKSGGDFPSGGIFSIEGIDKPVHFILYGSLAFFISFGFEKDLIRIPIKKRVLYISVISFLYSVSDEVHQFFVPDRHFDINDIFHNLLGILFAISLLYGFNLKRFFICRNIYSAKEKNCIDKKY